MAASVGESLDLFDRYFHEDRVVLTLTFVKSANVDSDGFDRVLAILSEI